MTNNGRSRPRWRTFPAVALLTLTTVAGCDSGGSAGDLHGEGDGSAGAVALAYVDAMFSDDLDAAAGYVEGDSLDAFQLVRVGIDPRSVYAKDLAVGSTKVTGGVAVVILTGTVCHRATPPAADDCLSNEEPDSDNPVFHVTLRPDTGGDWKVALGVMPPASGTPAATGR